MSSADQLVGVGGDIAMTLDANVQVGDLIATHNGTGYPIKRLGSFEPTGTSYAYRESAIATLSNGNVVFAYHNTGHYLTFVIYDPTLTTVVVPATVVRVAYCYTPRILVLSGGGFMLGYHDSPTSSPSYAIYTDSGAVVMAHTSITTAHTAAVYGDGCVWMAQLSGGNVALTWVAGGLNQTWYAVVSSTGATVTAATLAGSNITNSKPAVAAAPVGNHFMLAWRPDSVYLYAYDSLGNQTGTYTSFTTYGGTNGYDLIAIATGEYLLARSNSAPSGYFGVTRHNYLAQLVQEFSVNINSYYQYVTATVDSNGRMYFFGATDGRWVHAIVLDRHTDTNWRIVSNGAIQACSDAVYIGGYSAITLYGLKAVAHPAGGVVLQIRGQVSNSNQQAGLQVALVRLSGAAYGDLSIDKPVTIPLLARDANYGLAFDPIVTKSVTAFPFGFYGPHIYVTNTGPIIGSASSSSTIRQSGKFSITNGVLPSGKTFDAMPLFGGAVVRGACISSTDVILGA